MTKNEIKIALIEDDDNLRLLVAQRIKAEGYRLVEAADGKEAIIMLDKEKPQVILLDWMLPGASGEEVCNHLRKKDAESIVIMMTAKAQEVDKINAYNFGVTDYITKPFDMKLLVAMIESKVKYILNGNKSEVVRFADMEHHPGSHILVKKGKRNELTILENRILSYFLKNMNTVVKREELMLEVWGYNPDVNTRTLDMHIVRLRKKIEENAERPLFVQTVRGIGYKFNYGAEE